MTPVVAHNVPVDAMWRGYKLCPFYPFGPMLEISEGRIGNNPVTVNSVESGEFHIGSKRDTVFEEADKNPDPMMRTRGLSVDLPYSYRITMRANDGEICVAYSMDAGELFDAMESTETMDSAKERWKGMGNTGLPRSGL